MKNTLFLLCFLLFVPGGCVKDTTLDVGLGRKVVVEFVLTEDSVQHLYLSLTGEPGEKVAPSVQEAEIKLIDITRSKELNWKKEYSHFVRVSDNLWTLDYAGVPGHEYRLEVTVDGFDTVWAEQKMPKEYEISTAGIGHTNPAKHSYVGYGTFFRTDLIPDCLMIQGTKRDKETGEYIQIEELCTDYPGVEEMNATGRFYDGNPEDGKYLFPNLIGKELHEGFLFINRVDDNDARLDRLYVFSAGYDYSTGTEDLSARGFCVSGSFHVAHAHYIADPPSFYYDEDEFLIFSSLSPDYGRFLKEVWQLKKVHEGGDLSSIYLRDNIHSNLQGGLGVFGAKVADTIRFYGNYQPKTNKPLPGIDLPDENF